MLKKVKGLKNKALITASVLMLSGTNAFAKIASDQGNSGVSNNFIVDVINSNALVKNSVQAALIAGVVYAVFNIGKSLLSGQGDAGAIWKNVGGIIFLGAVYYLLFM